MIIVTLYTRQDLWIYILLFKKYAITTILQYNIIQYNTLQYTNKNKSARDGNHFYSG